MGLVYLLLAAGIVVGSWYGYRAADAKASPAISKHGRPAIPVRTTVVTTGSITNMIRLTGALEAVRIVDVVPKIAGRLDKLELADGTPVLEGVAVSNGQAVAVLDKREVEAQMLQAEAAVVSARAAIETARVILKDKEREKGRMRKLFAEGSTTEQQRDLAETAHEQAETEVTQAEARLLQAEAAVELIRVTLSESELYAPMDGVISAKYVDPGAMVGPGIKVVQIMPMERLKFLIAVPGAYLRFLQAGETEVQVVSDAVPDRVFTGLISRIYPAVDPVTRAGRVEVELENAQDGGGNWMLRPGLYAEGSIILEVHRDVVVIPAGVALRRGERFLAFVVQDDETVATRTLETGIRSGTMLEVVSGLAAGESMVVAGQHRLSDGQPVRITEQVRE